MSQQTLNEGSEDFATLQRARHRRAELLLGNTPCREPKGYPFVSIVVLNFNGERTLQACLEHLLQLKYPHYEVLIVDNGSTDSSQQILKECCAQEKSKKLRIIEAKKNLGIFGGRNLGARHIDAESEIVAFVDNDGFPERNWLQEAVSVLESSPDIGALASAVFFRNQPLVINGAGGTMNYSGYARDLHYGESLESCSIGGTALFPMGCGMIVRRDVLRRIGPFDEMLMRWYDDVELGIRVWNLGFRVAIAPRAIVEHDQQSADGRVLAQNWRSALSFECARVRTVLKYFPKSALRSWFIAEVREDAALLLRGQIAELGVKKLAYLWNLAHLRSLLQLRTEQKQQFAFATLLHPSFSKGALYG